MPRSFSLPGLCLVALGLVSSLPAQSSATAAPVFNWTTISGRAGLGHEDGPAAQARFNQPHGLARDAAGNVYVADRENHTIRKIAPDKTVSTLAGAPGQRGSTDGTGSAARFDTPKGLAVDGSGNVYVADSMNYTVRKITPAGVVSTLAGQPGKFGNVDGPAASARFSFVEEIGADSTGNVYVVGDSSIRRISGGTVTTFYTGGAITDANNRTYTVKPTGSISVTPAGLVYSVAAVTPWSGPGLCIIRLDTTGTATFAVPPADISAEGSSNPMDIIGALARDDADGFYFFFSQRVYYGHENEFAHWDPVNGLNWLRLLANRHNLDVSALSIAHAATGELLYTIEDDHSVHIMASAEAYAGTPLAQWPVDGSGASPRFCSPGALTVDPSGNVWVTDDTYRRSADDIIGRAYLRKIAPDGSTTTPYFTAETQSPTYAKSIAADGSGNVFFGWDTYYQVIDRFPPTGGFSQLPDLFTNTAYLTTNTAANPAGLLAVTEDRGAVYKWDPATNQWSLLAGAHPTDNSPIVRKDGTGVAAVLGNLFAIASDRQGNFYVLDSDNTNSALPSTCVIRQITPAGVVTTVSRDLVVRTPANTLGIAPHGLAVGSTGQFYLCYSDHTVRLLAGSGDPLVIGGSPGIEGHDDGRGAAARFGVPVGLAIDSQDNLYVIDVEAIRKGQFLGYTPVITAQPTGGTFAAGSAVTLTVAASGTPAPTFQWYRDGASLTGATNATLKLASLSSANTGSYTVTATNTAGSALSTAAVVSLESSSPPPPPPPPTGGNGGSSGGGSGGGGAPSLWFLAALFTLAVVRKFRGRQAGAA